MEHDFCWEVVVAISDQKRCALDEMVVYSVYERDN